MLLGRGMFWLARERDDLRPARPSPGVWPAVVAVVPARNEADVIARSIGSLLAQDYPGDFRVILVDDNSERRHRRARRGAAGCATGRLTVIAGAPLPPGWTGKLWAMRQGVEAAAARRAELPAAHRRRHRPSPDNLRRPRRSAPRPAASC